MSGGVHPRRAPYLDSASQLYTAAYACREASWLWRASIAMADGAEQGARAPPRRFVAPHGDQKRCHRRVAPRRTVLYKVIADHLETFLASLDADLDATGLPAYVQREFYDYLQCGILAHGFPRLGCDTTLLKMQQGRKQRLPALSEVCKSRVSV
jgi:hypothetical protein